MPPLDAPVVSAIDEFLASDVSLVVLLSPFSGMEQCVAAAAKTGTHVLASGPLIGTRRKEFADLLGEAQHLVTIADGRYSPLHQSLLEQRRRDQFGEPVYVRFIGGGGGEGPVSTWWRLSEMLVQALDLLDSPVVRLSVTASRKGRRINSTLSITCESGAAGLISVLPFDQGPAPEILLLGTGGTVSSVTQANAIPLFPTDGRAQLLYDGSFYAEPLFISRHLSALESDVELDSRAPASDLDPLADRILSALRTALRKNRIIRVRLP